MTPDVQKAMEINKIPPGVIPGQPGFEDVLSTIMLELNSDVWVMHNAAFDLGMLSREFTLASKTMPTPRLHLCTMILSACLPDPPRWKGNKLEQAAKLYEVVQTGAHRAVHDARTCGNILLSMRRTDNFSRTPHMPRDIDGMAAFFARAEKQWKKHFPPQ